MAFKIPLPRTLHMRIMLAIASLQFIVVGLFSVYMIVQLVGNEVTNRQVLGHKILILTAPAVERMVIEQDKTGLVTYLNRLYGDSALSDIKVKDAQGGVIFSREKPPVAVHPVADWLKLSNLDAQVSTALRDGDRYVGLLNIALSNYEINNNISILLHNVLYLFLILLAIDLLASELLVKYLVSPLGSLTLMAQDLSRGTLDGVTKPSARASVEVKHLTNAFVDSAKIMRKQIHELEQTRGQLAQNELRLRNLVNNMQEVLLELDKGGHIQFLNPIWETLTGYTTTFSLTKPFSFFLVQESQQQYFEQGNLAHIALNDLQLELRAENGASVWLQMNTTLQFDNASEFSGSISTLVDITENLRLQKLQQEHEHNLYKLAITDPLTGVYNRRYFDEILDKLIESSLRNQRLMALLVIDIDGFKFINDTYGHPVGDAALKALSSVLLDIEYAGVEVARLAGDEFAVILQDVTEEQANKIANEIHDRIGKIVVDMAVGQLRIQSSMGVALAPKHGNTPQLLISAADVALYHAKKSGRNRVDTLSKDMGEAIMDIFSQGFELRNAVSAGMLTPFIQPIIELKTGKVFAYEVLTRLKRNEEYIAADVFVLMAEDLGLIREMDLFIIKQALKQVPKHTHLFLNISLCSFYNPEFSHELRNILLSPDVLGRDITIEFTERQTTSFTESFMQYFNELRDAGCKLALDDFGVGYSSYGYMRQLRPDFVKIDGSFVQQITTNQEDAKIVEQIIELSKIFGALSVAEHVENEETCQRLIQLGVKYGQGYYFGWPKAIPDYVFDEGLLLKA